MLEGDIAARFLATLMGRPRVKRLLSSDHFGVKRGDDAGLKTFAHATLPTLQEHMKMADTMDQGS